MKTSDFYFDLPEELIAQYPLENRDASRLMIVDKSNGHVEHRRFRDILDYLHNGDCIVLNDTKVIPARLFGQRENGGSKVEFLLLKRLDKDRWETLVKPGKKAKIGNTIVFGNGLLTAEIEDVIEGGARIVKFEYQGIFEEVLDKLGQMPLPPYIKEELKDKDRYQTVYAKNEGSAAAPTAGLHFTEELLDAIRNKGVKIVYITLHVGLGTFRPVKVEDINEHEMHSEYFEISQEASDTINNVKENGGKVYSVGTTSTRTLESSASNEGKLHPQKGWTDIFIYPGYKYRVIDGLITNFHLPESTLIMLVSAMAGRENILRAYNIAVQEKYRFFSFGDAMFIK